MKRFFLFLPLVLLILTPCAAHADADSDWQRIEQLNKGPSQKPTTPDEVALIARQHLARQLEAVRTFVKLYPDDSRVFEARLREADILAALGKMQNDRKMVDSAFKLYTELEAIPDLPEKQKADASFHRVALYMQTVDRASNEGRDLILGSIQHFRARYPSDRRTARLLVEVASIYDDQPQKKRDMLMSAQELSKDPELNLRIADDLKRLDLLGKPISIKTDTIEGGTIDTAALRGKVVLLLFWAGESPHCQVWLRGFRQATGQYSPNAVAIVTISLDRNRAILDKTIEMLQIPWPIHFDGLGWETPFARQYGINAVPTVWVLDKKGRLQALNARDSYEGWVRRLLQER